mgnify:CR=1 FL=1
MNNFTITINLDCSPRLEAFLTGLLQLSGAELTPQPQTAVAENATSPVIKATVDEKPSPKVETPIESAPRQKEITDVEIRSHIKACRERLLSDLNGEDKVAKNTYLTTTLREKVASYGVEKASELPQENRAAFIAFCDALKLEDLNAPF